MEFSAQIVRFVRPTTRIILIDASHDRHTARLKPVGKTTRAAEQINARDVSAHADPLQSRPLAETPETLMPPISVFALTPPPW